MPGCTPAAVCKLPAGTAEKEAKLGLPGCIAGEESWVSSPAPMLSATLFTVHHTFQLFALFLKLFELILAVVGAQDSSQILMLLDGVL